MSRIGFCGPTYQAQSLNADAQECINLYPEQDESGAAKSQWQMYQCPGLSLFSILAEQNRSNGSYQANGRCFAVAGSNLYEILANGTNAVLGAVGNDGNAVTICNSQIHLLVCSAGKMYVYNLQTSTFTGPVGGALGVNIALVSYSDGFFFALQVSSQTVYASGALDATSWDAGTFATVSVFPDEVTGMIVSQRELYLMGGTKGVAYADAGQSPFPFSPDLGSYIEQGIGAPYSLVRLDNTILWLGQTDRGNMIAWRLNGQRPQRISTYAQENAWNGYAVNSDAVGWTYEDRGHAFWHIWFPTENTSWRYDVSSGLWHKALYSNPTTGNYEAHLGCSHVFVFGQHLVFDRRDGNVYVMNINTPDDDGIPIQRLRRAPHISSEQTWIFHDRLQVDVEAGLSSIPSPITDGLTVVQISGSTPAGSSFVGPSPQSYIVVAETFNDGSRRISPLFGPFSSHVGGASHNAWSAALVKAPFNPNVVNYKIYFGTDPTLPASYFSVPAYQMIANGNQYQIGEAVPPA